MTLVQCGGHFPGSAVLHWAAGAGGRGVLLSGDTIFVTPGEDRVTFVWSAPNRLPVSEDACPRRAGPRCEPFRFDRIYGGWWTPVLRSGGVGDGPEFRAALHRASSRRRVAISVFCAEIRSPPIIPPFW